MSDVRDRLLDLLRRDAVLHGDFTLSSGQRSSWYLDARRVTLSAAGAALVGEAMLDMLRDDGIEAIAGMTVAADPVVTAVALLAGQRGRHIDGIIVRKAAKEHGTGGRMVGPWRRGLRVAVVDDTLTTGASALDTVDAVEEAGGIVVGVWALIDRQQGARAAIEQRGLPYTVLFTADELV